MKPLVALFVLIAGIPVVAGQVTPPSPEITSSFRLSPFYKKQLLVNGLPIVASDRVSDYALEEAAYLMRQMLAFRPELFKEMAAQKVRFSIMAVNEFTTDIPEHSDLKPKDYMDRRARGLGATRQRPAVSCGEENLLCYPGDPYGTENILIHEFGHAILQMGMNTLDPKFELRVREVYAAAMKEGLWKGKYASQNHDEYWAEGVQSWFDTNRVNDHDHNHVHTRVQIREYDPRLAGLLEEVFGDLPWRYQKPADRRPRDRAHLAGYDPVRAPRFEWPQRLLAIIPQRNGPSESIDRTINLLRDGQEIPASGSSTESSILLFENQTRAELEVFWIDSEKHPKSYGHIPAGGSMRMETFAGHVFEFRNAEGKHVAAVVADSKPAKAIIK